MSEREQLLQQVERLTSSPVLHGSESLCKLLRYLANQAIEHPGVPVKEYQIATEVFGRPADFDPQSDSAIRVQAGRLRSKLAEYYSSDGALDPYLVELPKGTYALSIHRRAVEEAGRPSNGAQSAVVSKVTQQAPWRRAALVLLALTVALSVALIWAIAHSGTREVSAKFADPESDPVAPAMKAFWEPFLAGPQEPWVVFSNAAFVGRPETGIRYFDASRDSGQKIWDHYTGVGEVLAVHSLDQVFASLHRRLRVKRGSLLSLDDASNNDLIFVGSPSENLTLKDIPNTKEFVFQRLASGPRKGDLAIVDVDAKPGAPKDFLASPFGTPLSEDYAVIGLMPGVNPERSVMILAGTTTFGTQAAAEYLARPDSVQELLARLNPSSPEKIEPFEALLHVKVTRGVPLEAELLAVRKR